MILEFQNMYLVAALFSYGFHYYDVNKDDKEHQKFQFEDDLTRTIYVLKSTGATTEIIALPSSSLDDAEQFFIADSLMLLPGYPEALRRVKYILHSSMKGTNGEQSNKRTGPSRNSVLPNGKPFSAIG